MSDFLNLVNDKKQGKEHSIDEITWIVNNLVDIPDYQLAAWLMAVCLNGLTEKETTELTRSMAYSGHILTLQRHRQDEENRGFVDKHSTGGVGDKVSLSMSPLLASIGFKISKFSGRSLGHTGGTVDKLEAIPGFRTDISMKAFEKQIDTVGMALAGQTEEFAPADKRLYALRDKSGTVESIPLIASSIMSKKIAGGADIIILDVKVGRGAFMKNLKDATELAKLMKKIGENLDLRIEVLLTNMDQPLGYAVGNLLEVQEAIETLKGNVKNDFYELVVESSATIASKQEVEEAISSGKAYDKFKEFIEAQGGDLDALEKEFNHPDIRKLTVNATEDAYVKELDAFQIGSLVHEIGYSLDKKPELALAQGSSEEELKLAPSQQLYTRDDSAGITLHAKIGDKLEAGEPIFTLQGKDKAKLEAIKEQVLDAYLFSKSKVDKPKLIYKKI